MIARSRFVVGALVIALIGCGGIAAPADAAIFGRTPTYSADHGRSGANGRLNYARLAASAVGALEQSYYTGSGTWNMCVPAICNQTNTDWGADSLTYSLYLHWKLTGDRGVAPIMNALTGTARRYTAADGKWSGNSPDPGTSYAPYRIYNIGNNNPVELLDFIETLERCLGKKAEKNLLPIQAGDVPATCADVEDLMRDVGFRPATPIAEGIKNFVEWYRDYYVA